MIDVRKIFLALAKYLEPLKRVNWKVILLCFTTAATFWFFNALNKDYTTRINYPVELDFNRDSLVVVKDGPKKIPINVTGGGWKLLKRTISVNVKPVILKPENPVHTSFLTANNLLPIFSDQLTDLNINYIAIDTIEFKIDPYADKRLCIKMDSSSIHLKDDFFITSELSVEPDSVNFHGPLSLINQLPEVFLVSLPDKNINDRYDEELSLDLFSHSQIKKDPEVIHISFDVEEFVDENITLDIEQVNFPYDSTVYIQISKMEATFKVQKSFRSKINKEDFLIIADLSNIHATDSTITIEEMDAPKYVKDITFEENRVKVIYGQ